MIFYVIRPMFRPCRLQVILAAFSTYPLDKSRAVPFAPEPSGRFCAEARTLQDFRVKIVRNRQEGAKISEENPWRTQILPEGTRIRGVNPSLKPLTASPSPLNLRLTPKSDSPSRFCF